MDIFNIAMIFILVWWIVIFMVLPVGVKIEAEAQIPGQASSAPTRPHLLRKCIATTIISLFITVLLVYLAHIDVISMDWIYGIKKT